MRILQADAERRYGPIIDGKWANEAKWCTVLHVPTEIGAKWINSATGNSTLKIYCNKDIAPSLLRALLNVRDRGLIQYLKTFDGCYEVRDVRARPGVISAHSYAIALDINAGTNPLGGPTDMRAEFVKCFTDEGFIWGAEFSRPDPMHMSFGW